MCYVKIKRPGYELLVFVSDQEPLNEDDDNIDVQVDFDDGTRYSATFFTLKNIHSLFAKNRESGECLSGTYFYANDMLIVEKITIEIIEKIVSDLMETDELAGAFMKLGPRN